MLTKSLLIAKFLAHPVLNRLSLALLASRLLVNARNLLIESHSLLAHTLTSVLSLLVRELLA